MTNLNDFGNEYNYPPLDASHLLEEPFAQFESWLLHAIQNQEIEPNAMTLATVNKQYQVSARMMLLKYFDKNGFVFFSNYLSRKAVALGEVKQSALVFWWAKSARQIRIEGNIEKLDEKHSDQYFSKRSQSSQCAALASQQSQILANKDILLSRYQQLKEEAENKSLSRPSHWGGYILKPNLFEFWQGRPHRLHDRFVYQRQEEKWIINRLSP
ncbi:MAG: pyridoxamine 5'-phosphate oxidase [Candidatus Berkiella sp.]